MEILKTSKKKNYEKHTQIGMPNKTIWILKKDTKDQNFEEQTPI